MNMFLDAIAPEVSKGMPLNSVIIIIVVAAVLAICAIVVMKLANKKKGNK